MKKTTANLLIIATILFCSLAIMATFIYVKFTFSSSNQSPSLTVNKEDLEEITNNYILKEDYARGIDYLQTLADNGNKEFLGLKNYCLALLRHKKLEHLSDASEWKEYHRLKLPYAESILEETKIVIINLPKTKYALEAQFLRYLSYKAQRSKEKRAEEFDKFKEMLFRYGEISKEYDTVKEYASRLYQDFQRAETKELNKIYSKLLQLNLPSYQVKVKLKAYAQALLDEGRYEASGFMYDEYFGIVAGEKDEAAAASSLKEIMEIYIKAEQFDIVKKYAEIAIANYPEDKMAPYFRLKLAKSFFELNKPEEAKKIYYKMLTDYPDSKYKETVLMELSEELKIKSYKNYEEASNKIRELLPYTTNPETEANLLTNIADIYFLGKKYEKSLEHYQTTIEKYPDTVLVLWITKRIKKCEEILKD